MRANGNASQWGDEYPDRSIVTYDIACGNSYVMLENGEIVGTFALFLGEDESYRVIEDGAWHLDQPYGTPPTGKRVACRRPALTSAPRRSAICAPTRTRITARCSGF